MSSDDDTILSAYLDGQLDTDRQQRVESALVASPRLAENLRGLGAVRDLVAGLQRDAGVDVAPEVMRRIRGLNLNRPRPRVVANRPWAVWARGIAIGTGSVAVAASILLLFAAVFSVPRVHHPLAGSRQAIDNVITDLGQGTNAAPANEPGVSIALGSDSSTSATAGARSVAREAGPPPSGHGTEAVAFGASSTPDDLVLARQMLDNPAERRLFLIDSGRDGKAQQKVASVVERTSRFGFFKITVSQGIVIDPRHPDQATVFALLVSPKELGHLRDQLKDAMPDPEAVEESPAEPGIVTQLADIGQVQQYAPVPAADSSTRGELLALRTRVRNVDSAPPLPATAKAHTRPTAEQERSAPFPANRARSIAVPDPEQVADVASADSASASRIAEAAAAAAARGQSASDPLANAKLAPPLPKPEPAVRAGASDAAKPDEMILVFVWVCKSRPS